MSKKIHAKYTSGERKAEQEIDAFLEKTRVPVSFDIIRELQQIADA